MSPGARPRARRVVVEARAKLNLGLAVGPRRADGFHELATVFQSITLADTLAITPRRRGFRLGVRHERAALRGWAAPARAGRCRGRGQPGPARGASARGPRGAQDRGGLPPRQAHPARAGLGGGSADRPRPSSVWPRSTGCGCRAPSARTSRPSWAPTSRSPSPAARRSAPGAARGCGRWRWRGPSGPSSSCRVGAFRPPGLRRPGPQQKALDSMGIETKNRASLGRERVVAERAMRLGNSFESVLGSRQQQFEALCARLRAAGVSRARLTGSGSAVFGIVPRRTSAAALVASFEGTEALYLARSARRGCV